jgi:hypothetical protein
LVVHQGKHVRQISFLGGEVRSARSNRMEQRLGQYLMRVKAIDRVQLLHALSKSAPEGPIGQRLVSLGFLGEDRLAGHLEGLVREIVFETCEWGKGEFRLYKGKPPLPADLVIPVPTVDLVFRGFKNFASEELAKQVIGDLKAPLVVSPQMRQALASLTLDRQDTAVLKLINGSMSAEQLLNAAPGEPEENLVILASLVACGLVSAAGYANAAMMQEILQQRGSLEELVQAASDEADDEEEEAPPRAELQSRPQLSSRDIELYRKTIHEKFTLIGRNPTHYEFLGLAIRATLKEIRTAHSMLTMICEERLRESGPLADLAKKMEAVEERADEAYRVLGNQSSRDDYNRSKGYRKKW